MLFIVSVPLRFSLAFKSPIESQDASTPTAFQTPSVCIGMLMQQCMFKLSLEDLDAAVMASARVACIERGLHA